MSINFDKNKNDILESIKGKKTKYKRLALSPIRYAGGKSLAVGHIIESLPDVSRVISPFFGGGSIEIAIAQKLNIEIVACDINKDLVNYWYYQINRPIELYNELVKLKLTKKEYLRIKEICKLFKNGEIELSELEQATYFFYNHNLSYGPGYIGWASSVYLDEKKYKKMIEKVRDFKANIKITLDSFENLFKKYPNDFFYCDPPYFLKSNDETSKMFSGIYPERNNPIHHKDFDHEKLRDLLKNHKCGFILSYNDCDKSREYYKDYTLSFPAWQYTMGQGESRIGKDRIKNNNSNNIKKSHEILITSIK